MPEDIVWGVVYSVSPTILIGLLFWFIMRAIIRADATERTAFAEIEAEERAKREQESASS